jgi:D-tyrosyl-tRNA(Tyr) deacylase
MRAVVQRVTEAAVHIHGREHACIGRGMLVLLGVESGDSVEEMEWLVGKVARLRIFADDEGQMNLNLNDVLGDLLLVSQFTLQAGTRKGNRPSFIRAAHPDEAVPLYLRAKQLFSQWVRGHVRSGEFGADMQVSLVNDGPVTIIIDSKLKE